MLLLVRNMKKIIYILLVMAFFNCSFFVLYYLKVFNKLDISYLLTTNLSVFLFSVAMETLYSLLFINKFNYFFVAILGLLIGVVICFIVKGLLVEEYLFIVTFTSFALTFLTYNIYFDNKNEKMVKDNKEV